MFIQLGRLVRDIEVKEINGGKKVLNNALAVYVDKGNTAFIDITAWETTAEFIAEHFKKGDRLVVNGKLRNKKSKLGEKELSIPYILIDSVEFAESKQKEE